MKVLLTGPDGVLGHNLVRTLLDKSYEVNVFIEEGRSTPFLDDLPLRKFYGNILNNKQVEAAMEGCDYVIHAAAKTDTWPCRHESYWKVNVEGTAVVLDAARKLEVKRFIHVGTANSFGSGCSEKPGTEESGYCADRYGLDYISSKYRAHLMVLEEAKKGLNAIIVNPTFMLGPFDVKPSSGAMLLAVKAGVPGYPAGGRNFVYVKDVAIAITNALEKGRAGESYLLGNQNLSYKEIFALMAAAVGVKAPKMKMSNFITLLYGAVMTVLARMFSFTPRVNYRMSRMSTEDHFYSAQKAVAELEMPQTPITVALDEAVTWFRANGYM
ncbi:MAG: NAD-dependent epimerase/dehydratase family protein [Marinilabiliaceae bacterium]|jgi:dihydroflavonol-4-reductase|nr:NAD-dependent epimerase/dehydratase family protein [Marinilabiliaceae bacterium]